jgi:hypothetical protein
MTTTTATTTTHGPAVWATTKGLVAGDLVAKGQPKVEPLPASFALVTSVEMKDAGHKVITLEGGEIFGLGGVATKVWIRRANATTLLALSPTESAEARVARHQALAVRKADQAAQVAAEKAITARAKARRTGKAADKALAAADKATAKAAKSANGATKARPATKALVASPSMKSAAAARVGEDASLGAGGKALAGYVVRWPQAGYDVLVRTDAAQGTKVTGGSAWLVRCNEHGAVAPAANVKAAFDLARKGDGIAAWCPAHAAAAAK